MPETTDKKIALLRPKVPCPECGKPSQRRFYPFCSARCKNVDLNRWLTGAYAIPSDEDDEEPDRD